ncbi:DNA polymerase III subunit chi [Alteromonas sp. ASW11-130]|uniref:DNA polymerase III subunit chi n=1 Tax=Alteromonas sp. ASW11-130 TaxID=3015775 RepID=UPI0022424528|nr:DNA polymerase III subunit chi [Alteromonas sp. ASW11-130]MCW8091739.1 DNA polymerase III subunit chi [Alteromonas sp. ASW11-130]
MPQVVFHALGKEQQASHRACELVADAYSKRQRCRILCANQKQAEEVDELLWQMPPDRFIPHNMYGEGPASGTPVEICWQPQQIEKCHVIINLTDELVNQPQQFLFIYDFVPADEEAKQKARLRYKHYQQAGFAMQFESVEN